MPETEGISKATGSVHHRVSGTGGGSSDHGAGDGDMFIEYVAPGGGIPCSPDFSRVNRGDIAVGSGAPRGFPSGTSPARIGGGMGQRIRGRDERSGEPQSPAGLKIDLYE